MDQATIARYQPGGDLYAQIVSEYGQAAADGIAAAAATGDQNQVNNAFAQYTTSMVQPADSSLLDALGNQFTSGNVVSTATSYWGATANSWIQSVVTAITDNFFVLAVVVSVVLIFFSGRKNRK
jgi:hypothetical protein